MHNIVNVLRDMELSTLEWLILCHVNFTWIENNIYCFNFFFKKDFIEFREREQGRGRETHRSVASHTWPDLGSSLKLGMCPNQKWNPQPFGLWDDPPTDQDCFNFFFFF